MRNDAGTNKPEHPSGSSRKSSNRKTGTAGRETKARRETSPQHTDAQKDTMQTGLRLLARIIARAHLERQAEPGEPEPPSEPRTGQ